MNDLLGRRAFTNAPKDLSCNVVNKFFTNLNPSTIDNLPFPKFHYNKYVKQNEHSFLTTDESMQELKNVINSIPNKSSAVFDGLSIKLLKLVYPILSKPLLLLINKSFTSGCYPDFLKIARVVPIFKS